MTSARLKPMLFTSIWTSSAPGGGTSRFSIFSTLASPYSWKRTMLAMISPLLFCDLRNHRTMPQLHFAFEHLGQHRWECLHVRQFEMRRKVKMCLPVDETGRALSMQCLFLVYCSVEKLMHQRPNPIPFFFQREMARVEKMELRAGNISFKEFSTLHRKDSIVFAPSDQRGGLLFTEIRLPNGIGIQIPFCVGED